MAMLYQHLWKPHIGPRLIRSALQAPADRSGFSDQLCIPAEASPSSLALATPLHSAIWSRKSGNFGSLVVKLEIKILAREKDLLSKIVN